MEYRMLGRTGLQISALGFGASSLGGVFRTVEENECKDTVHYAIEAGINFIDVSPYYGITKAEIMLGKALRGVPRDAYYLATKVGRYGDDDFDFSSRRITRSIDESLSRIGVDYIDVIQCHDIEFGSLTQIVEEAIPALQKARDSGKVRFVGVTGLPLKVLREVVERIDVDTVLSYCHNSLNDDSLVDLIPTLTERGVGIINASPLSMGLLSHRGAPSWHPASEEIRTICGNTVSYCDSHGINIEKLALQFAVSNPAVSTTLVGTANPDHLRRNIKWIEQPMSSEELREVWEQLAPIKNQTWTSGRPENN